MRPEAATGPRAPLAVSMGDPAGIGIEIALRAWARRSDHAIPPFVLYADPQAVAARAQLIGLEVSIVPVTALAETEKVFPAALPLRPVALASPARPGLPDPANAPAVIAAIEQAVAAVTAGEAAALVTNPIAKHVLAHAGFAYPGHTEFLAALAERFYPGTRYQPVMMLAAPALRVVPLTVHCALNEVPGAITREAIETTVRIMHAALRRDFAIAAPRIAVTGLNPHAGEEGRMGREEIEIIAPAIAALRAEGLSVTGPHPADTLFHAAARQTYDAAVAMYHDQALIPFKTLAFEEGVNVTLGLPFVRTSPDHGTAFDIAAKGAASARSFVEAVELAQRIAAARSAAAPA